MSRHYIRVMNYSILLSFFVRFLPFIHKIKLSVHEVFVRLVTRILFLFSLFLFVSTEQEEMEAEEDFTTGSGLPERCRFWPNCKNGDTCPFHHPTVPCKLFPNCKYGKKCLFVHPQCKFDSRYNVHVYL